MAGLSCYLHVHDFILRHISIDSDNRSTILLKKDLKKARAHRIIYINIIHPSPYFEKQQQQQQNPNKTKEIKIKNKEFTVF